MSPEPIVVFAIDPKLWVHTPIRWGLGFARELSAEVLVVHVRTGRDPNFWENVNRVQDILNAFADTVPCLSVVLDGEPATVIADYAAGVGAVMVLASSAKHTGVMNVLRTSTAQTLQRISPCPVLILNARKADPDVAFACRTVLCTADFDVHGSSTIAAACELAEKLNAPLSLLYVAPEVSEALLASGVEDGPPLLLNREDALQHLRGLLPFSTAEVTVAAVFGPFHKAMHTYGKKHQADLIVCSASTVSQYGLGSILGSVACPLLTMPAQQRATQSRQRIAGTRDVPGYSGRLRPRQRPRVVN